MAGYRKITKPTARKLYNAGYPVWLLPCKCRFVEPGKTEPPLGGWVVPYEANISQGGDEENRFDRMVNTFVYYNCNVELGYYPSYFVREDDLKNKEQRI